MPGGETRPPTAIPRDGDGECSIKWHHRTWDIGGIYPVVMFDYRRVHGNIWKPEQVGPHLGRPKRGSGIQLGPTNFFSVRKWYEMSKKNSRFISSPNFLQVFPSKDMLDMFFFGMGMPCTQISGHAFLADPCWLQVPFSRTSSGCIKKSALWPKSNVMSLSCGNCQPQ